MNESGRILSKERSITSSLSKTGKTRSTIASFIDHRTNLMSQRFPPSDKIDLCGSVHVSHVGSWANEACEEFFIARRTATRKRIFHPPSWIKQAGEWRRGGEWLFQHVGCADLWPHATKNSFISNVECEVTEGNRGSMSKNKSTTTWCYAKHFFTGFSLLALTLCERFAWVA